MPSTTCQLQNPTGREGPCKLILLYYPIKRKEDFFFFPSLAKAEPVRDSHSSANEKPLTLNSQFTPMDFQFEQSLSTAPFALYKSIPLLCSPDLPMVLPQLAYNSLLFLIARYKQGTSAFTPIKRRQSSSQLPGQTQGICMRTYLLPLPYSNQSFTIIHLHCGFHLSQEENGCHDSSDKDHLGPKILLPTGRRSPLDDWL